VQGPPPQLLLLMFEVACMQFDFRLLPGGVLQKCMPVQEKE
jgi:hypothetical protein